jgi:DNA-binding transcriptional regulator YiaG
LNVFDKEKNFTREWSRLITKKQAKEPIDIKELRKFYKISKEVEVKINELINQ